MVPDMYKEARKKSREDARKFAEKLEGSDSKAAKIAGKLIKVQADIEESREKFIVH